MKLENYKNIHFIGIGGSGMSGIAYIFKQLGYSVSGSDIGSVYKLKKLKKIGITVYSRHDAKHINFTHLVVISSAIPEDNVELRQAILLGVKVISRGEMLACLMNFYRTKIAIAGSHGKTTVTSILCHILIKNFKDPTYVIGGEIKLLGNISSSLGKDDCIIVEADESDASFLKLDPNISVITNIDFDHMATYDHNMNKLKSSFIDFGNLTISKNKGLVVLCEDDLKCTSIKDDIQGNICTYGFRDDCNYQISNYSTSASGSHFQINILRDDGNIEKYTCITPMFGVHNAQNTVAAFVVAHRLGINVSGILNALKDFPGAIRRFNIYNQSFFNGNNVVVIDDYGHHPNEIKVTLETIKDVYPTRRIVHCFQPHRYSRTRDLFNDIVNILSLSDIVILLDTYSAGDNFILGATSDDLSSNLKVLGVLQYRVKGVDGLISKLYELIRCNDVVLIQGAGDISETMGKLTEKPVIS